jgi:hypothetical protein
MARFWMSFVNFFHVGADFPVYNKQMNVQDVGLVSLLGPPSMTRSDSSLINASKERRGQFGSFKIRRMAFNPLRIVPLNASPLNHRHRHSPSSSASNGSSQLVLRCVAL